MDGYELAQKSTWRLFAAALSRSFALKPRVPPRLEDRQPGSRPYLLDMSTLFFERAADGDNVVVSPTDAELCAAVLRRAADRSRRRTRAALVALTVLGVVGIVGVEDRNRDGRVDLADLWLAARAIVVPGAMVAVSGVKEIPNRAP